METSHKLDTFPFSPFIMIPFWHILSKKKLEEYKLDDAEKPILATYKVNNYKDNRSNLNFDAASLSDSFKTVGQIEVQLQGCLKNYNTIEAFNSDHKTTLFQTKGKELLQELRNIAENPEKYQSVKNLNTFLLATYADLKHHLYRFSLGTPIFPAEKVVLKSISTLSKVFSEEIMKAFEEGLRTAFSQGEIPAVIFFKKNDNQIEYFASISTYFQALEEGTSDVYALIVDPYNQENKFGEPLENFIALNLLRKEVKPFKKTTLNIVMLKDFIVPASKAKVNWARTQLLQVDISEASLKRGEEGYLITSHNNLNESKVVDLKSQLDEKSLSSMAVDLNIKLMKWRLLPELDIPKVQGVKCLLFGAGTLGCQLARNLIGWGIRHITFIDYGKVSHSNPVRQSLFDFEDAKEGKPKAKTAAEKLAKIFPEVVSEGYNIEIPMPGHYAQTPEKMKQVSETLDLLEKLVQEHDALFLMTDNRESRWLPTVLANKYNKICITVGLGFDTYVIVRHGASSQIYDDKTKEDRLGCYFCNDILSPNNSMKDRSLDQQCTVTRPGLSFISSAYACELLVSLLHHPLGVAAPGYDPEKEKNDETPLGYLPQYLRGSCSEFDSKMYISKAFPNCVACSEYILHEFSNNRDKFMFEVMNNPDYLQKVTKIDELLPADGEGECIILDDDDM